MRTCPYCAEEIQTRAVKCKHCGSALDHADAPGAGDTLDRAKTVSAGELGEGRVLADRYRVGNRLGSGGMGEVWKAVDTELNDMPVAIKVLPPVLARNPHSIKSLKREAAIALRLTHPRICRLYTFNADGDVKFLVMEYIEGQTLEELLDGKTDRRMMMDELLPVARDVAEAVDHAHSTSPPVLHRDIKPSNIMVTPDGHAKVLDFGIARELKDSMTRVTGQETSGTLLYMSPEQFSGKPPTPASDVYSLAATLYECLAGHPPFYQGSIGHQLLHMEPTEVKGIPPHLNAALWKGLAKDHLCRPTTAQDLVELIELPPESVKPVELHTQSEEESKPQAVLPPAPKPAEPRVAKQKEPAPRPEVVTREPERAMVAGGRDWAIWLVGVLSVAILCAIPFKIWYSQQLTQRKSLSAPSTRETASGETSQPSGGERSGHPSSSREQAAQASRPPDHEDAAAARDLSKTQRLDLGGGVVMELVLIEAGEFVMGSPSSEANRNDDEGPQHRVRISKPFYLGKYEVTQAQWRAVMGSNPSHFKGDDHPVEVVYWNDCQEFCRKLSERTGRTIRLPTEAEWEYSCRGGTTTAYSFGDTEDRLGDHAWFGDNSSSETHPVGKKQANRWGLYDMHGNVWEWCNDQYDKDYYANSPGTDPTGSGSGKDRVLRGGSWGSLGWYCRCSFRFRLAPDTRSDNIGFRVASGT